MDMMSDFDNMDVMIGNENINPIERELANTTRGSVNHLLILTHEEITLIKLGTLVMKTPFQDRIESSNLSIVSQSRLP